MNSDFVEYVLESRYGDVDPLLHKTLLRIGMVGVPDPDGEVLLDFLDENNLELSDLGFSDNEVFKFGEGFVTPVWSSTFNPLFFISYNPDRAKDPNYRGGKYINLFPDKKKEQISSMRLFGMENTKKALESKVMFVTEGFFDKIILESQGLPACATLGTHIGKYHQRVLNRFDTLVYIGDNDVPGKQARDKFIKMFPNTVAIKVPREKDVDDFRKKHPQYFDEFITDVKNKYMNK